MPLHAKTNEPVKRVTKYVCADTGSILMDYQVRCFASKPPSNIPLRSKLPMTMADDAWYSRKRNCRRCASSTTPA